MAIRRGLTMLTGALAAAVALAALGGGGSFTGQANGHVGAASRGQAAALELKDARLKFEINATDDDGGVQVFIDADSWRTLSIFDPGGRRILTTTTAGRMASQGGTELFLESAEPPFTELSLARLLERWPAGSYRIQATRLDGKTYVGAARLTHAIPDGPTLVSPLEGDGPQDPRRTVVRWKRVSPPSGSRIIGYQVLVVKPDTGLKALPTVTLDVMMPPTATSLVIPPGFLQPKMAYEWEVLAIERSGNQTLSSDTFTTAA